MAFLAPLLGAIAGPVLGGIFGGRAAQPAATAADTAAQATANLTNTLMNAYTQTWGPAETAALQRFQGISNQIPTQNIVQSQIINDLLPTYMPDILRSRAQFSIQQHVDNTANALRDELTRRGVTGPGAEALISHVREQGIQSQAELGSNIGAWEAQQTLANRRNAFLDAMGLTSETAQYAQSGARALPGLAMQGGLDLTKLFGQQAQAAAAPYYQMGQNLGKAASDYYATPRPQTPPDYGGGTGLPLPPGYSGAQYYDQPMAQPLTTPGGSYGGGTYSY